MSGGGGFPASGTARVLAPVSSGRAYRAERPAFAWLVEREVLRFLKIWYFTIAGHVISALLFVVVFGFALSGRVSGVPGVSYADTGRSTDSSPNQSSRGFPPSSGAMLFFRPYPLLYTTRLADRLVHLATNQDLV